MQEAIKTEQIEKEISPEEIEKLPDYGEQGSYYRGVKAEDALMAVFGKLKIIGERDNASVNLHEAIYFSPSSRTRDGKKFLCAVDFDPLPEAEIKNSHLGNGLFARVTGTIIAREIIVRFAGKKPGQPAKQVKYFSPKEFYQWYVKNVA